MHDVLPALRRPGSVPVRLSLWACGLGLALGLCAGLAGCRADGKVKRKASRVLVEAGPPQPQDVEVTLRYPVELSPAEKVNVSPVAVSGYLTKVLVDVGDKVAAGQLLAEIDCREYSAQLRQ